MAKFESPIMVIGELRRQEAAKVLERHTITSIYQKFLETGLVEDRRIRSERLSTITDDRINEVEQGVTNQCKKNCSKNEHFKG